MTNRPMEGVRILEVAQYTFVPAASGVLADWGADVIKVEHAVTGDAQRGLTNVGASAMGEGSFKPIMEHPNRGKRSIGLALEVPEAKAVLHELVRRSDVFLTNFLPSARKKLKIEVEDIRAVNPDIIYARGTGFGVRGPEADKGGFDGTAFWSRGGSAFGVTPSDYHRSLFMPSGAYGDSMGGMTIAGGIAGALFARERTGEPSVVDVSLLSVGSWAMALSVNLSLFNGGPIPAFGEQNAVMNPIHGQFKTSDGRWLQFSMLQPGRYWADLCRHIDRDDLITDERFNTTDKLIENALEGKEIVRAELGKRTLAEWREKFTTLEGPWAAVQNAWEVGQDPQSRANGYIRPVKDMEGNDRELVASPVQFDETPFDLTRAPQFAEHTDEVLRELGYDDEGLINLKIAGAVT